MASDASTQPVTFEGYVDLQATERERIQSVLPVGKEAAHRLVQQHERLENIARILLRRPDTFIYLIEHEVAQDDARDALQEAGFEPPCDCKHWQQVVPLDYRTRHGHREPATTNGPRDCGGCGELIPGKNDGE